VQPEIFNADQCIRFASNAFTNSLYGRDIRISMDGKGCLRETT
jgi:putative transposase